MPKTAKKPTTKGLKPKQRKLATVKTGVRMTANQWQNTPQQNLFMKNYMDVDSPTFSNAYQSALKAGYSETYAVQVASIGNKWIQEYQKLAKLELEHLELKLAKMINGTPNSKSPDDTKIKAIETIARLRGLNKPQPTTNVTLVQPILMGKSYNNKTKEYIDVEEVSAVEALDEPSV